LEFGQVWASFDQRDSSAAVLRMLLRTLIDTYRSREMMQMTSFRNTQVY